ncbi:hypothetical protein M427DRAFT_28553 [Gonapodya prolifera JEL478]|uniref:Uncharacterized protein n=1 Tax=Gonapodya prolifera (strain JEL478) TaxID=1344416 RepID=A0A139AU97_GONPJ|nr:hypothetical protein M427DRAFT_28553 [Gonapodya prolifera JEL478]|eukprot:KXS20279.1 hypothetical protein M427DRAFT_28553 [Gonapodya prolifera JEL478]
MSGAQVISLQTSVLRNRIINVGTETTMTLVAENVRRTQNGSLKIRLRPQNPVVVPGVLTAALTRPEAWRSLFELLREVTGVDVSSSRFEVLPSFLDSNNAQRLGAITFVVCSGIWLFDIIDQLRTTEQITRWQASVFTGTTLGFMIGSVGSIGLLMSGPESSSTPMVALGAVLAGTGLGALIGASDQR